jgi:hypothetical protein
LKVFGFLIVLYGWFILDYQGFSFEGAISVLVGIILLCGTKAISSLQWRRYSDDK